MKKQLKETIEDKKLIAINTYLNIFLGALEEVVKDNGDIYLREFGDKYAKVWIKKKSSECWVDKSFWDEFSELFSLKYREVESIINKWVEDTYQFKGIDTCRLPDQIPPELKIPTN